MESPSHRTNPPSRRSFGMFVLGHYSSAQRLAGIRVPGTIGNGLRHDSAASQAATGGQTASSTSRASPNTATSTKAAATSTARSPKEGHAAKPAAPTSDSSPTASSAACGTTNDNAKIRIDLQPLDEGASDSPKDSFQTVFGVCGSVAYSVRSWIGWGRGHEGPDRFGGRGGLGMQRVLGTVPW